jgi:hypothetical protein
LSPTSLIFSAQLALAQVGRTRRTASCNPVILGLQVSKKKDQAHDDYRNCQTSRVLRQSRGFPDLIMIEDHFDGHREPWASDTQCTAFTTTGRL